MTRAAAVALGLPLVSPRHHGDALTALYRPEGVASGAIVKGLKADFGVDVAGGQGKLKGQILRVAHLGYYDATDILGLLGSARDRAGSARQGALAAAVDAAEQETSGDRGVRAT